MRDWGGIPVWVDTSASSDAEAVPVDSPIVGDTLGVTVDVNAEAAAPKLDIGCVEAEVRVAEKVTGESVTVAFAGMQSAQAGVDEAMYALLKQAMPGATGWYGPNTPAAVH